MIELDELVAVMGLASFFSFEEPPRILLVGPPSSGKSTALELIDGEGGPFFACVYPWEKRPRGFIEYRVQYSRRTYWEDEDWDRVVKKEMVRSRILRQSREELPPMPDWSDMTDGERNLARLRALFWGRGVEPRDRLFVKGECHDEPFWRRLYRVVIDEESKMVTRE